MHPPRPITAAVNRIHGIRDVDVADAPPTAAVAAEIRDALAGRVLVGHHVHVDLAVLRRELSGWAPSAALDTLRLAKAVWPGRASYRLDALTATADFPASSGPRRRHRAGYDAEATAALFERPAQHADGGSAHGGCGRRRAGHDDRGRRRPPHHGEGDAAGGTAVLLSRSRAWS